MTTAGIRSRQLYRGVTARRADQRAATTEARLERAWLEDEGLRFESRRARDSAIGNGVFLLRVPRDLTPAVGDLFARQFYLDGPTTPYRGFRKIRHERFDDPLLGFHERTNQVEQFLLERRFWRSYYPAEIAGLGEALTSLSRQILTSVLDIARIPEELWRDGTGGCSVEEGSYHLTFNHYRPQVAGLGLNSHKDDGFVTIVRATTPGLEVNSHNRWEKVPADPEFFVVNFGLSMEILTARAGLPVGAILHRVCHQSHDRTSFGHFSSSCCIPGADQGIYQFQRERGLVRVCSSRELIESNDFEIYNHTHNQPVA